jgi:hypothetical protein
VVAVFVVTGSAARPTTLVGEVDLRPSAIHHVRFDEFFDAATRAAVGPMKGLVRTTDFLPPEGADRVYRGSVDWESTFDEMVTRAEFVIAAPGNWRYLRYELSVIARLNAQSKLMSRAEFTAAIVGSGGTPLGA